mgnify:CR=1 FL=1
MSSRITYVMSEYEFIQAVMKTVHLSHIRRAMKRHMKQKGEEPQGNVSVITGGSDRQVTIVFTKDF